ncbi:MAG: TerB family tellurite resistance protein [Alphaproteobacteria bacterium]|nr:TerB family tellurite resistance protein [Alphaproteobacteria bacterium]
MFSEFLAYLKASLFRSPEEKTFEVIGAQEATVALLVHAITADSVVMPGEGDRLRHLVQQEYELNDSQTDQLINHAYELEAEAVDFYTFTKVLTKALNQEERQHVVGMLWELVYADGEIHEFEDNFVWRIAELLSVSSRDRLRLKRGVIQGAETKATENEEDSVTKTEKEA